MIGNYTASQTSQWMRRPLCRRYVCAEFKTLHLPVRDGDTVRRVGWRWALGLFKQGQYEVLGVWPAQLAPGLVAEDLHDRGIEQIKVIAGTGQAEWVSTYPDAVIWSSAGGTASENPPAPAPGAFGPRRRATLHSAAATAERLQACMTRAIQRHPPFEDEAAAAAFLAQALERADRRLHSPPKALIGRPPSVPAAGSAVAASAA
ncbi:hypothetical protein [Roseateles saccharophilus]|uniref:Uncharacterized protein n=1 Tax=Roseateles saccharophilus TaxID=304 RepID=A0A4R3U9Z5_ROSSA|nr:hypothetical protein [Roseateles saccharophilus]MDG0835875.1 hypothetical protein [Roseateles saccharophilus]TCU82938.1 hypothetical protein EV671_106115 [Roseateles saccharophilus]